ncbi:hypothetical protein [Alkalicoccus luteus]|uniref:Lipoprotein n=1 Tax=Alkalicoccus luteus TaxID=1237094 RepID=A0A969PMK3_9BACI|nr:hypothetical protein [Alkalicoccus luteus]NJP36956.1 hypothetical protein [Alkalicoccus luteus]
MKPIVWIGGIPVWWMGKPAGITAACILLGACSLSDDQLSEKAEKLLQEKVKQEPEEPTVHQDGLSVFLPDQAEMEKSGSAEFHINVEEQIFILNLDGSEADQEDTLIPEREPLLAEVSREGVEEAFFHIAPFDGDAYEVMVGSGSAEISGVMRLQDISEQAGMMFDIVQSAEKHDHIGRGMTPSAGE